MTVLFSAILFLLLSVVCAKVFQKNRGEIQNSRRQKVDMKQVPNWGLTSMGRHRRKFCRRRDVAPRNVNYCSQPQMTDLTTSWYKRFYSLLIITVFGVTGCRVTEFTWRWSWSVGSTRLYFSAGNRRPSFRARSGLCVVRSNDLYLRNRVPCKLIFRRILQRYWPRPQNPEQHLGKLGRWNQAISYVTCSLFVCLLLARQPPSGPRPSPSRVF